MKHFGAYYIEPATAFDGKFSFRPIAKTKNKQKRITLSHESKE